MSMVNKQGKFTLMVAQLVVFAFYRGYTMTYSDAYREPSLHGKYGEKKSYSHAKSLHKLRLAVDFNVFKDGLLLSDGKDFQELGEFWESIGGSWGGRFKDGGHFSLEHDGVK